MRATDSTIAHLAAWNAAQDRARRAYYRTPTEEQRALALAKAARHAEAQKRYRIRKKEQQ